MRSTKITLDGKTYDLVELRVRANAKWVRSLEGPAREVVDLVWQMPDVDLEDKDATSILVDRVMALLGGALDQVTDLAKAFAPNLADEIENAYSSEVVAAFIEMVKLAVPFDLGTIKDRVSGGAIQRLLEIGLQIQQDRPNLPDPSGESGTTS